jgi:hypothetical protein
MTVVTARVNQITLNRGADLSFNGENVYVPFGNVAAKDLPETLDRLGADRIVVEYRTVADPKVRERDRAKFTKRLADLGTGWTKTEWTNRVTDGFVFPDTMQCVLTRIEG